MISAVRAAQRLDSRGNPTVQVDVTTDKGEDHFGRLCLPERPRATTKQSSSIANDSVNPQAAYNGLGVDAVVRNIETIIGPALIENKFDVATELKSIDAMMRRLDGSKDKSNLGANAILGVSMACARAGAAAKGIPLYEFLRRESGSSKPYVMPVPFFNVLNGGVHSGNQMAFQEFMIAPTGATSITHASQMGAEIYHELKKVLTQKYGASSTGIGDEGGFAPPISQPQEALDLLVTAVAHCNYTGKVHFGIDPASSEFFDGSNYDLSFKVPTTNQQNTRDTYDSEKLASLYRNLLSHYPVTLLEDPYAQDDWEAWAAFDRTCKTELVGDDLLATNVERIKEAEEKKACNSLLLKINQIGTISEAISAAQMAYSFGWKVFVSHRSGETTDDFIADLAVGLRTGHLKSGSPCRGERVAKYNRLMDIEDELRRSGQEMIFAGPSFGTGQI